MINDRFELHRCGARYLVTTCDHDVGCRLVHVRQPPAVARLLLAS